jgi:methyl-accepting chemotaxis protein
MRTANADREAQYRVPLIGRFVLAFGLVMVVAVAAGVLAFRRHAASQTGFDFGIAAIMLPTLLAGALAAWWLWRSITGALRRMCTLVEKAAEGQADVAVRLRDGDEFSALMRKVLAMGQAIGQRAADAATRQRIQEVEQVRSAEAQARRLSAAEHARQLQECERRLLEMEQTRQADAHEQLLHAERQREYLNQQEQRLRQRDQERLGREAQQRRLAREFESRVADILDQVHDSVQALRDTAAQMAQLAGDSARRSNEASSMARQGEETAAHVASGANGLSEAALRMRGRAEASRAGAQAAVAEAADAATAIRDLSESTRQITDIAGIISDITRQTSLLSINARIEAARAGEAGRGFAVVASEVMELAARTRRATDSIDEQIGQVTAAAQRSADVLGRLGQRIGELGDAAGSIYDTAEAQCRSTLDISERIRQINRSTQSVSASIGEARGTASEAEHRSSAVLDAAEDMEGQIATMQRQVADFVRGLQGEAGHAPQGEAVEGPQGEDPYEQTVPYLKQAG